MPLGYWDRDEVESAEDWGRERYAARATAVRVVVMVTILVLSICLLG